MHFLLHAFYATLSIKKEPQYRVLILSWYLVTCRLTVRTHGTPAINKFYSLLSATKAYVIGTANRSSIINILLLPMNN